MLLGVAYLGFSATLSLLDMLPELNCLAGALDDWGLGMWIVFFDSLLRMLVRKALFLLVGAVGFPTSAQPRGVFTAITWSEHPSLDCSCIWAARQSLPISKIVGHSEFLIGNFVAKSENSGIACTSSLDGTCTIWDGRLCCITVGGSVM